jgi:hypothetical protein
MAANLEIEEGIVTLPVPEAPAASQTPVPEPLLPGPEPVLAKAKARRAKPPWLKTAVLGVAALLAAGTLGYVANTAAQQRNQAFDAFVSTKAALVATDTALSQAKQDAASKKVTADYVAMYVADSGKVQTDYQSVVACSSYSTCRTAAQQFLEDAQAFQADRGKAVVPSNLTSTDASLGDALSAAIAGDQELIDGMDNDSLPKIRAGGHKVDAAMLNIAKAEASMGSALK